MRKLRKLFPYFITGEQCIGLLLQHQELQSLPVLQMVLNPSSQVAAPLDLLTITNAVLNQLAWFVQCTTFH